MTHQFKLFKNNGVLAGYAETIQEAMSTCDRQKGWYFEKNGKLTKDEIYHKVIRLCINKQLEPYGVTYDDVKKGGGCEFYDYNYLQTHYYLWGLIKLKGLHTKKIPWYQYLTFDSKQEFNEWKEFCINLFRKELKMSKTKAETEFGWFNLNYGLKQNYEVKI